MFADPAVAGLSPASISVLFILWSVSSFVFEIPTGILADRVPRRPLLVLGPLLTGVGFALWTWWPSFSMFALGFVLWAAGGSLRSGTLQALVFDTLAAVGRAERYATLTGRMRAMQAIGVVTGTALAVPLAAWGGYHAVGAASVLACVLCAATSAMLPERRPAPSAGVDDEDGQPIAERLSASAILRDALRQLSMQPAVRRCLFLLIVLTWVAALDEYLPLLADEIWPGSAPGVALLMVLIAIGDVAGGLAAARTSGIDWRPKRFAIWLGVAALALVVGAGWAHPAGMVLVAFAFGVFGWSLVQADAMLAHRVSSASRATITSIAGVGEETVAIAAFAGWALGAQWLPPTGLFVIAAVPYLLLALVIWLGATTDRADVR
ncbi:MFS transporter [Gordonia sp. CPCC 205515]|uniref:MFS transporter n=1 Tax=Gordonia sp. CPCC 205515 TaxID=3140791 RepID=UPI003AF371BC